MSFLEVASHFLLKVGGLEVSSVTSVRAAMDLMSKEKFDVIVSDYQMPETDGIEFLKTVRSRGWDIPFILFTGKGREDVVIDALNQGADYYLQKGGDLRSQFHELASMITQAALSKRASVQLVESQERLRRLADSISDSLVGMDDDFRITFWNRAAKEVIGIDPEDAIGRSSFDIVPQIRGTRIEKELKSAAKSREKRSFTFEIEMRGEERTFDVSIYPGEEGLLVFAKEVTATREAQRRLEESEERYKALVEASPDAIIVFAVDRILYANPSAVRIYGGDLIGKRIFDLIPPEFVPETAERIRQMYEEDGSGPARIMKILTESGRLIDMEVRSTPVMFSGKKAIQSIARDVTERRLADRLVRAHQEELRRILDSVPAMISYQDTEGRFVRVNRSFAEATGIDENRWRGRKIDEVLPGFGEVFSSDDGKVVKTRKPLTGLITPYQGRQGVRWARTDKVPYVNEEGDVIGIITVAEDITDKLESERRLARQRVMLENIDDAVMFLDPNHAIEYWNAAAERMYGFAADEVLGMDARQVLVTDYLGNDPGKSRACLEEDGHVEAVLRQKRKDGTWVQVESVTVALRDSEGKITGYGLINRDITERVNIEEALRKVNKKLNLLGSVTRHDSLNQIGVLKGWLDAALEKESDDSIRSLLLRVDEAASSLKTQLEFTSQYKSLGMKRPGWISLAETIAKVTEGLGRQGISVAVDVEGFEVFADPMLENVFRNLVNNAIAHGGEVSNISISHRVEGDALVIVFEDDGVGIALEEKEKIFERGHGKRHGYGLYLSREILSITGMTMKETGAPGEGARFEISVPGDDHRKQAG
jgi:PAS domain S-box-containing protein